MVVITAHLAMMWMLWVVLVVIGLNAVVMIVHGLRNGMKLPEMAEAVTRPMLIDILPLIILALLIHVDPTHVVMKIWYFVAAILVVLKDLMALANKLSK